MSQRSMSQRSVSQRLMIRPAWFWTLIAIGLVLSLYFLPTLWPFNQQSSTNPAGTPIATTPSDTLMR
ncbi:MAG: hypothetical protein ACI9G1_003704 [Pirellulaceae bacterium]|jgi:hypothetical protein